MNQLSSCNLYEFGDFSLDSGRRLLFRDGETVPLPPKAFDLLLELVASSGRILEKEELIGRIWQGVFVEENNLTVNMTALRKALGERRGENRFITTVPGRGYKFVAPVREVSGENLFVDQIPSTKIVIEEKFLDEPKENLTALASTNANGQRNINALPSQNGKRRSGLLFAAVFLIVLLIAVFIYFISPNRKIESVSEIKTLAILPFKPLEASPEDALLGLGMADSLITKLSNVRRVTVRPTSAMVKYAHPEKDLTTIGNELGVDALLDGRMQRTGDKLRVSVQLIRVSDNVPLWAGDFETKETDIFALQDSISRQVAETLTFRLNADEQKLLSKQYTQNPEAYKLYLNGLFQLNKRTLESARRAISYFEQAAEKEPTYALAYAGIGDAYIMLGNQEALLGAEPPRETLPKAKSALIKALALDNTLPEAHAAIAWIYAWEGGSSESGEQSLRRALELNPDYAMAHNYYGLFWMTQGEFDKALAAMKKAQELDQFSLVINLNIGTVLYRARRYEEAAAQTKKTLELDPNFARAHWLLGLILEQQGNFSESILSFQKAVELSGGGTLAKASLAHAEALAGNHIQAEKILSELREESKTRYVPPDAVAAVYVALNKKDEAFRWLEKAVIDRPFSMFLLKVEQRFDALRADRRFQEIENKMRQK